MADVWKEPTAEQREQARIVQGELIETINRLLVEGIDYRVVMAGMGSAVTDLIATKLGATAVAPWFEMQAKLVRSVVD